VDRSPVFHFDGDRRVGESHVPDALLVANDLAGTAQRMASAVGLSRASFASYLVEAACDITLNVLLYALLRPVSRNLALLAAAQINDAAHTPRGGLRECESKNQLLFSIDTSQK
jgi:uncharacterized protein DUF4386